MRPTADFVRLMAGTSDSDDRAQIIHVGASALGWQGERKVPPASRRAGISGVRNR
jgi:hypothetical protein